MSFNVNRIIHSSFLKQFKNLREHGDLIFGAGILLIVGILLFPVPTILLDLLLSLSIAISVLILMTVLFILKPLELSSFPTILLVVTVLRLALNVSTTRLILANGHQGTSAAGHVVEAFGYFVMRGSVAIGAIVFAILTIINFVVITKGSGRIAEVAARFSLDSMPGKQMAIDADIAAGIINQEEAKSRRKNLEDESTFFGAMDGANKFVRGDAVAGLLIIFINLIAGILIGVVQKNMTFGAALKTYSLLTIGDGLVSQIPALIVSIAAGLLVAKSSIDGSAEKQIFTQLGRYPKALMFSSFLSFFMAIMPGTPAIQFCIAGFVMGTAAYFLHTAHQVDRNNLKNKTASNQDMLVTSAADEENASSNGSSVLQLEKIKIELGYNLLELAGSNGSVPKLTKQVKKLRERMAMELGIVIPAVRIRDNIKIDSNTYIIKIKEIEVASGMVYIDKLLVMEPKGGLVKIPGEETREPTFGLLAKWVESQYREKALLNNYTVVDPQTVIITHLTEAIKENISELITYDEVENLLKSLPSTQQKLISDLIPGQITIMALQRVLQGLLSEGVSIRDLTTILEAISEKSSCTTRDLIEHVRSRLARQICHSNTSSGGYIPMLLLSGKWENAFNENIITKNKEESKLVMPPHLLREFVGDLNAQLDKYAIQGEIPVLLTSAVSRPFVRSITERIRPNLAIMSQNEVHPRAQIKTLAHV
ncbi:MAG: flagellar biosynthesis protein FlhA [Proteobacteria bacterium]|nr:flagellar biosynthesis protein FlhA [Pseudomonadota bacterium]